MDTQRVQYRKYLERAGVIDAMSNALVKLYEGNDKPENAIRFVRKFMCEVCPDDDHFDMMRNELEAAHRKIASLERDLERLKSQIKPTDAEFIEILEDSFRELNEDEINSRSLLSKYLTREVFDELLQLKTAPPNESNLLDCVKSGFQYHNSRCGIYAADADCYDVFSTLFDPIIRDYHGQLEAEDDAQTLQPEIDYGDLDEIENLDRDRKYIQSTRIRIGRNLEGYPYFPKLNENQLTQIEKKVWAATEGLDGEHTGAFYRLEDLNMHVQDKMVQRHILFGRGDPLLQAAGCYRFWQTGRGIFHNPAETFMVWVNEKDHLRIISIAHHGDLGDVYHRLITGLQELEKTLKFARHPNYGFLGACPTNLGTALRASVHIRLPLQSQNSEGLKQMITVLNLQIRNTFGNIFKSDEVVMEISNKVVMGATEFEIIKGFQDGIKELIKAEEELEAGGGDKQC